MLYVKTALKPSSIHGLGCFAAERILEGTLVMRWTEGRDYSFTREEWNALPAGLRAVVADFTWVGSDDRIYGSCDDGRFTNHSHTPNLIQTSHGSVALRDIEVGEELLEDYEAFDADFRSYSSQLNEDDGA